MQLYSHLEPERHDSGGRESCVDGAGHAAHAPGAGEATGEGDGRGAKSGHGCVGGGVRHFLLH